MTESVPVKLAMTSEREKSQDFGVAIFLIDRDNRVFVIREKEGKAATKRKAGEYGVFCETREPNEGWVKNIRRGLEEEAGIPGSRFSDLFDFSDWSVWETGFVDKVWATVVKLRCKDPDLFYNLFGTGGSPDGVEAVGWKTLDEFKNLIPLREGVSNVLQKYEADLFKK